ncbi:MAG: AmmeMemoRadiSam system radical SAM enzyme [Candidatus Margulisiibacteriota bacterium]|jgi:pyruvate formate lyase activating enzyme
MNQDNFRKALYWHVEKNAIVCDLCPRNCKLKNNQIGFCLNRKNINGELYSITFNRISGSHIDPIEKKPLNHFYPGSAVFSFGTVGCNLNCNFCQNWHISKSSSNLLPEIFSSESIANLVQENHCRSIAFTYNEPIVFIEYLKEVAACAKEKGIYRIGVTAGYINEKPRVDFFNQLDAVNIDLKGFSENFYQKYCGIKLKPILENIIYVKKETNVWLELTNLVIPGINDSEKDIQKLTDWIIENLGPDVPLHFSAFSPQYKLTNNPVPSNETLLKAREIAISKGLNFVYTGNMLDNASQSTYCSNCKKIVIERRGYEIGNVFIKEGKCSYCNYLIAGRF